MYLKTAALGSPDEKHEPASSESIQRVRSFFKSNIPTVLTSFWACTKGAAYHKAGVYSYSTEDIIERNETYEIQTYGPDLILIGDDGGGNGYLMPMLQNATSVWEIDLGAIGSSGGTKITEDFESWLKTDAAPEVSSVQANENNHLRVNVHLISSPKDGLKGLLRIKKRLALSQSIAVLGEALKKVPYPLLTNVYLSKYKSSIEELNREQNCLEIEILETE